MQIAPASLDQLRQSGSGRWVAIDADVGSIAQQIAEIAADRGVDLSLRVSEVTGVFKVVQLIGHEEQLVTTAQDCDQRLVDVVRRVTSPMYDLAAEAERLEREADRAHEHEQSERVGEVGERLAHAIAKDLGESKPQIVVPRAA